MRKIVGLVGLLLLAVLFASTPSSQQLGHTLYVNKTDPTCQKDSSERNYSRKEFRMLQELTDSDLNGKESAVLERIAVPVVF